MSDMDQLRAMAMQGILASGQVTLDMDAPPGECMQAVSVAVVANNVAAQCVRVWRSLDSNSMVWQHMTLSDMLHLVARINRPGMSDRELGQEIDKVINHGQAALDAYQDELNGD